MRSTDNFSMYFNPALVRDAETVIDNRDGSIELRVNGGQSLIYKKRLSGFTIYIDISVRDEESDRLTKLFYNIFAVSSPNHDPHHMRDGVTPHMMLGFWDEAVSRAHLDSSASASSEDRRVYLELKKQLQSYSMLNSDAA
jgi:hypothetical protein